MTAPDSSEIRPLYNEAGLLEKVEARVRGAAAWTTFVDDIDYDAKGQREKIVYGNGTRTTYTYAPETFRLVCLKTVRDSDDAVLQNLTYTYDPVGNITEIKDSAQQTVFFDNDIVSPSAQYVYDALYRLIEATGREHAGGVADVQRDQNDVPLMNLPHANDAVALRNYVEKYVYDSVGNLLTMSHEAGAVDWTRRYEIEATSNRLLSTSLPGDGPTATHFSATYGYDAHGNMTSMPHLPSMGWDHNDQMQEVDLGGGGRRTTPTMPPGSGCGRCGSTAGWSRSGSISAGGRCTGSEIRSGICCWSERRSMGWMGRGGSCWWRRRRWIWTPSRCSRRCRE